MLHPRPLTLTLTPDTSHASRDASQAPSQDASQDAPQNGRPGPHARLYWTHCTPLLRDTIGASCPRLAAEPCDTGHDHPLTAAEHTRYHRARRTHHHPPDPDHETQADPQAAREPTTHACPPAGHALTPCCHRTLFDLPLSDRVTLTPDDVTCRHLTAHADHADDTAWPPEPDDPPDDMDPPQQQGGGPKVPPHPKTRRPRVDFCGSGFSPRIRIHNRTSGGWVDSVEDRVGGSDFSEKNENDLTEEEYEERGERALGEMLNVALAEEYARELARIDHNYLLGCPHDYEVPPAPKGLFGHPGVEPLEEGESAGCAARHPITGNRCTVTGPHDATSHEAMGVKRVQLFGPNLTESPGEENDSDLHRIRDVLHDYMTPHRELGKDVTADGECLVCSLIAGELMPTVDAIADERRYEAPDFFDGVASDEDLDEEPDEPELCHCGEPVAYGYDGDPTHHRVRCADCDAVRCDAYPGACTETSSPDEEPDDETTVLLDRMAALLRDTSNVLKGEPEPLTSHSWHDLPEVAETLVGRLDFLRDQAATVKSTGLCSHPGFDRDAEGPQTCVHCDTVFVRYRHPSEAAVIETAAAVGDLTEGTIDPGYADEVARWALQLAAEAEGGCYAGAADQPGDLDAVPTPAQWLRRLFDMNAGERLRVAESLMILSERAVTCYEENHQYRLGGVHAELRVVKQNAAEAGWDDAAGYLALTGETAGARNLRAHNPHRKDAPDPYADREAWFERGHE